MSKLDIKYKKGVRLSFDFVWYSIHPALEMGGYLTEKMC